MSSDLNAVSFFFLFYFPFFDLYCTSSTVLVFYSLFEPPHILLSDDTAIAAVFADKETFAKPFEDYKILRLMGKNVVTEEGAAWRAHRKLVGPSFSEKNNKLVWRESIRLIRGYFEMLESQSNIQGTLEEADSTAMCLRLALVSFLFFFFFFL